MYQTCLNCTSFMFSLMIQCVKGYCIPRINIFQQWILSKFVIFYQGCGNIIELSALCRGGNFNIHIWAWFGCFVCWAGGNGFYLKLGEELISCWATQACVHFMKIQPVYTLSSRLLTLRALYNHKMFFFLLFFFLLTYKHCGPRSDCSCRSSLIWAQNVLHLCLC